MADLSWQRAGTPAGSTYPGPASEAPHAPRREDRAQPPQSILSSAQRDHPAAAAATRAVRPSRSRIVREQEATPSIISTQRFSRTLSFQLNSFCFLVSVTT